MHTPICIAHYSHTSLELDPLNESFAAISDYLWKSSFTATSGKNITQYRMMLEYAPSLKDALADDTNITWLARELEKAGLMEEYQRKSLETSIDSGTRATKLITMITSEVCSDSENFTTFRDVLKKDKATYGHILANMKYKGIYMCVCVCVSS